MGLDILSILIYIIFIYYLLFFLDIIFGYNSVKYLSGVNETSEEFGKISVIIPARNEERNIEKALRSILSSDYPTFEVIVVNDRSEDNTKEIIKKIQADYNTLKTIDIGSLPEGWLGKNYALHSGVSIASGNYYLFTDADVIMQKDTLKKAMSFCKSNNLDHLAVAAVINMPGLFLRLFSSAFIIFFSMYAKPWKAKDPKSKRYIGLGAFNLVKSEVYKNIGGHNPIKMRPDDDIKLGKLIKSRGFRQDMLFGKDLIEVEWYSSFKETLKGLIKNSYAGIDYNFLNLILSTIGLTFLYVFPVISAFFSSGIAFLLNLMIFLFTALIYLVISKPHKINFLYFIGFPFATLLFLYILWRSTIYTLVNGGIVWKDTKYSLKELKANKI